MESDTYNKPTKLPLEIIRDVLQSNEIEEDKINHIMDELKDAILVGYSNGIVDDKIDSVLEGGEDIEEMPFGDSDEIVEEKKPRVKKEYVVLYNNESQDKIKVGWVLQHIPENAHYNDMVTDISSAAREFNETKRGRKEPVRTIGEAIENVPARFFKERGWFVKTKEPIYIIGHNNKFEELDESGDESSTSKKIMTLEEYNSKFH